MGSNSAASYAMMPTVGLLVPALLLPQLASELFTDIQVRDNIDIGSRYIKPMPLKARTKDPH